MNNNKEADILLAKKSSAITENIESIIPKTNAWFLLTLPVGIGLRQVLDIIASRSDSYHMFKAPAAPDPIATANREIKEELRSTLFGAINKPTIHVNKTNDITLGFIKLKNEFRSKAKPSLEFLAFESVWLNLLYFRQLFKSMERWR